MRKRLCTRLQTRTAAVLIIVAFLSHNYSRAQFLGFTSPQTITQAAKFTASGTGGTSTTQTCAGVGAGVFFNVTNIGQSVHYTLYQTTGTITSLGIEIQGSKDGTAGSFQRISETANAVTAGGLFASIYLPIVRLAITGCTGTGSITATYTGTSVATGPPVGIFTSSGTYNKDLAIGRPANVTDIFTVPLPNGGTGGAVYFKFSDATCAASTLLVEAGPDANHTVQVLSATTLVATSDTQAFSIAALPATIARVTYSSGCLPSAATYDLSFSVGERIVTANVTANFQGGSTVIPQTSGFECTNQLAVQFTAGGAGTTEIVPLATNETFYICHLSLSLSAAAALRIDNGTGVNCATGTASLTGDYQNVATIALDFGWWAALRVPQSNAICIDVSAATTVGGVIVYAAF